MKSKWDAHSFSHPRKTSTLFDLIPCSQWLIEEKKNSIFFFCLLKESSILTVFFFSSRESLNSQVTGILRVKVTVNVKAKNDIWDNLFSSFTFRELHLLMKILCFPNISVTFRKLLLSILILSHSFIYHPIPSIHLRSMFQCQMLSGWIPYSIPQPKIKLFISPPHKVALLPVLPVSHWYHQLVIWVQEIEKR